MFICEKHGKLSSEWCEECNKLILCTCEEQEVTRYKDLFYDCETGERTITLDLYHCAACGEPFDVEIEI